MSSMLLFLLVFFTVLGSMYFSGCETGVLTLDELKLKEDAKKGCRANRRLLQLLKDKELLIGTILVGNNLMMVSCSALVTSFLTTHYGAWGPELATLFVTPMLLMFGEILPKAVFLTAGTGILLKTHWILSFFNIIFRPLAASTIFLPRLITQKHRKNGSNFTMSRNEMKFLLRKTAMRQRVSPEELKMIGRLLDFKNKRVRSVMVPLIDVSSVEINTSVHESYQMMKSSGYSNIPVYSQKPDNIEGVIFVMDLLKTQDPKCPIEKLIRAPFIVPEQQRLGNLLPKLWEKQEIAIVVDEYGVAVGIVTLEDLIEEILGDIQDEFDISETYDYMLLTSGNYIVNGTMNIQDFNESIKFTIPQGDYDTIAGFVCSFVQRIPARGEKIVFKNLEITVLEATHQRVQKMLVRFL